MPRIIYKNKEGERLPSVTTVISGNLAWNKQALMYWAWKMGMDGKNFRETGDKAATVGTLVHGAVEAEIKGQKYNLKLLCEDKEQMATVNRGLTAWQEWKDQSKMKVIASEVSLVSEKYQFGGTLDCAAVWKKRSILDIKTGKVYPDHLLQIVAYAKLWNEHNPDNPIEEYHLLQLGKDDGSFHHHRWVNLDNEWVAFKALLTLHNCAKFTKKKV